MQISQIVMRTLVACALLICCASAAPYRGSTVLDPNGDRLGAVATEKNICSDIGINLLKQGGNAADALTGSVFCIGVTSMYHSGIGGGGFMLVRAANGTYEFIDFRETAPAAGFENMYGGNYNGSIFTGLAR